MNSFSEIYNCKRVLLSTCENIINEVRSLDESNNILKMYTDTDSTCNILNEQQNILCENLKDSINNIYGLSKDNLYRGYLLDVVKCLVISNDGNFKILKNRGGSVDFYSIKDLEFITVEKKDLIGISDIDIRTKYRGKNVLYLS